MIDGPPRRELWCPVQYTPVSEIFSVVRGWIASSEIRDGSAVDSLIERNGSRSFFVLGPPLVSGDLRSAAIETENGTLIALLPRDWRRSVLVGSQHLYAVMAACLGEEIYAGIGPPWRRCRPIVALYDLAKYFGHVRPPPEPSEIPPGWERIGNDVPPAELKVEERASNAVLSGGLHSWMQGYAAGFIANGRTVKRADAIKAAVDVHGCSTREADAAFKTLPFPGLRHPPRTPQP